MSLRLNTFGQATVEYLLLLVFLITISLQLVGSFTDFMADNMGNLGHVLSYNLSVGVCDEECFFSSFNNGYHSR